ncbi:MAG: class I SAM-dependent methyltransferase, partial [Gammaproteobacteria bacterium]
MDALINKWNASYSQTEIVSAKPVQVLSENAFLLPATGTALDLACGLGGNAIFLAQRQLAVTALDISTVAIEKLNAYATRTKLAICARQQAIDTQSLGGQCFDVIVISRFLDRALSDAIIDALKPDGLLFYQTFTREKTIRTAPSNPDYLLA